MTTAAKPASIDAYIADFTENTQQALAQLRATIRQAAPHATETIKYAMPTFVQDGGNLIHFAAFKRHIGLYPAPVALEAFAAELSAYKTSKGAVQFPLGQPLPLGLITRIVQFRMAQVLGKKLKSS